MEIKKSSAWFCAEDFVLFYWNYELYAPSRSPDIDAEHESVGDHTG